jgi:hypothetical protein
VFGGFDQPATVARSDSWTSLGAVALVLVQLCLLLTILHVYLVDLPAQRIILEVQGKVLANTAPAPIQYRFLPFWLGAALEASGIGLLSAHALLRGLSLWLAALAVYFLLRSDFIRESALAGTLLFLGLVPFTYHNYSFHPEDSVFQFLFLGALLAARRARWGLAVFGFVAALLCRETALFLPLFVLVGTVGAGSWRGRWRWGCGGLVLGGAILLAVRQAFGWRERYTELITLGDNFSSPEVLIYLGIFLGPLVVLALTARRRLPRFWRRGLVVVAVFIPAHFVVGLVREFRLFLPIIPLLIPGVLVWVRRGQYVAKEGP